MHYNTKYSSNPTFIFCRKTTSFYLKSCYLFDHQKNCKDKQQINFGLQHIVFIKDLQIKSICRLECIYLICRQLNIYTSMLIIDSDIKINKKNPKQTNLDLCLDNRIMFQKSNSLKYATVQLTFFQHLRIYIILMTKDIMM